VESNRGGATHSANKAVSVGKTGTQVHHWKVKRIERGQALSNRIEKKEGRWGNSLVLAKSCVKMVGGKDETVRKEGTLRSLPSSGGEKEISWKKRTNGIRITSTRQTEKLL